MTNNTLITLDSTLEHFVSISNIWCGNELIRYNLEKEQKAVKAQIAAWLKAHNEISPRDIRLAKGHFDYMSSTVRLTADKILEYAKERNLPLPLFQEMIRKIQVPGEPYLAWRKA